MKKLGILLYGITEMLVSFKKFLETHGHIPIFLIRHKNLQTTLIYTHVATKNILGVKSPLDS